MTGSAVPAGEAPGGFHLRKELPAAPQEVRSVGREPPPGPRGGCGEQPGSRRPPGWGGGPRDTCRGPRSPRGVQLLSPPWLPHENGARVPRSARASPAAGTAGSGEGTVS